MAAEVVRQHKGPRFHQSQLRLDQNPASLHHLGSGRVRGPITEGEVEEGGTESAAAPTWPLSLRLPATCSCSSQTPAQPVAKGLVSVCRLGQPQWGLSWLT